MQFLREYSGPVLIVSLLVAFIIIIFGGFQWLLLLGAYWLGWGPDVVEAWRWRKFRASLQLLPGDDLI